MLRYLALLIIFGPIPVVTRSQAWVCGHPLAGNAGLNPAEGMDACLFRMLCVVQVQFSATSQYLVRTSPHGARVCLTVRLGAATTSGPTMSRYREVKK
jgi:hypothetical protein